MSDPASPHRLRPVERADVPAVVALVTRTLAEFGLTFGQGATTDAEMHDLPESYTRKGGGFWVMEAHARIVGTVGVSPVAPGTFELRKM